MAQPVRSDLHIDKFLSNLSVAYMNEESSYIADKVFPVVPVNKQSDKYAVYEKGFWFRDGARVRAPLTKSAGGGWDMATPGTFFCEEYGFHKNIADEDKNGADDVFNLENDALIFILEKLRLRRELDWANKFFGTGVWTSELQGQSVAAAVGTDEFLCWDVSGSAPVVDVKLAKRLVRILTGKKPNTLVVSERVHDILTEHADVQDKYKHTHVSVVTAELLAKVFEVDNYVVASAVYESAEEGATSDMGYICGQYDALLVYSNPNPSKRTPSGGYTFRWKRPMFGGRDGERLQATIRKYRLEEALRGDCVEGSLYEDQKLVSADCGVFFDDAIAGGRGLS